MAIREWWPTLWGEIGAGIARTPRVAASVSILAMAHRLAAPGTVA